MSGFLCARACPSLWSIFRKLGSTLCVDLEVESEGEILSPASSASLPSTLGSCPDLSQILFEADEDIHCSVSISRTSHCPAHILCGILPCVVLRHRGGALTASGLCKFPRWFDVVSFGTRLSGDTVPDTVLEHFEGEVRVDVVVERDSTGSTYQGVLHRFHWGRATRLDLFGISEKGCDAGGVC